MLHHIVLTGLQPYELMFGHKAPMPFDNWLELEHYKFGSFKFKTAWLGQQLDALVSANKHALKLIIKTVQHSKGPFQTPYSCWESCSTV